MTCIGFGPCSRPVGPKHLRFCDRCQERRVASLTTEIAARTAIGQSLVGTWAIEFGHGRMAFLLADESDAPRDHRTREYRAWKAGWDLEKLLDMQEKGWP